MQKSWVAENGLKSPETYRDVVFLCQANHGFQLLMFLIKSLKSVFVEQNKHENLIFWETADMKTPQKYETSFNILSANQCCRSTLIE